MVAGIESTKKKKIHSQDKKTEASFVFYFHPAAVIRRKTAKAQGGLLLYTEKLVKPSSSSQGYFSTHFQAFWHIHRKGHHKQVAQSPVLQ